MTLLGLGLSIVAGGLSGGPISPAAVIAPALLGDVSTTRTMGGLWLSSTTIGAGLIGGPELAAPVAAAGGTAVAGAVELARQARSWRRGLFP